MLANGWQRNNSLRKTVFVCYHMVMFQVTTESFSGPLEKLLELIEAKKLDITHISLAEVTGDFIAYVESLKQQTSEQTPGVTPRMLADFLVVASHLILLKSKTLVPDAVLSDEEEEGIMDLERRLLIYSKMKPLFALVKQSWATSSSGYTRQAYASVATVFYPAPNITHQSLTGALGRIMTMLGAIVKEREVIQRQIISLEEKVSELLTTITSGIQKFSHVVSKKSKEEIVVLFLALLHLLRDNQLSAQQADTFGDITIQKT